MRLSPLDIRKQDFDAALRGYSKEDVDAFLQMVSTQWEEVLNEQRRLEDEVRALEGKMQHYQQVEEALQEALQTARENAEQKLENAERQAALAVQEAEAQADDITREARNDRDRLRRQADQLQERRDQAMARLRAFLMSELELLMRFDGTDPSVLREALPGDLAQHLPDPQGTDAPDEDAAPASESAAPGAPPSRDAAPSEAPPPEQAPTENEEESVLGEDSLNELTNFLDQFDASGAPAAPEAQSEAQERQERAEAGSSTAAPGDHAANASAEETPAEEEASSPQRTILNSIFSSTEGAPGAAQDHEGSEGPNGEEDLAAASDEEIEKIRRILNDMEE